MTLSTLTPREAALVEVIADLRRALERIQRDGNSWARLVAREADERADHALMDFPVAARWGDP